MFRLYSSISYYNLICLTNRRASFDEGATDYDEVDRPMAYARVMKTWGEWVDENLNPNCTIVFFNSMSPLHIK